MAILTIASSTQRAFRGAVLAFALILICEAVWILAAEFFRSPPAAFPDNEQAAAELKASRNPAAQAARIGLMRGDLWAEYALTYSDQFWGGDQNGNADTDASHMITEAREAAGQTLRFAPHDASAWLILANLDARFDWLNGKSVAALRMSYYTGANETELIPLRLVLSVQSKALADEEIQQLLRRDLRFIVTRRPEMKPTIVSAYQDALPAGKQFLENALETLDPGLLSSPNAPSPNR